eukprot:22718-Eustigmatos_ZCMA.PRE.1
MVVCGAARSAVSLTANRYVLTVKPRSSFGQDEELTSIAVRTCMTRSTMSQANMNQKGTQEL